MRNLSIHEYRSFGLMQQYGVQIPKGAVAHTPVEAEAVAKSLGTPTLYFFFLVPLSIRPFSTTMPENKNTKQPPRTA